jgi:Zn-dependent protease with chaperone function
MGATMSNASTEFGPWWELVAVLGLGSTVAIALAALLSRCVRSAIWERAVWQACTMAILALIALELTGLGRAATQLCLRSGIRKNSEPHPSDILRIPLLLDDDYFEPLPTVRTAPSVPNAAWWLAAAWIGVAVALLARMLWTRVALISFQRRCRPLDDAALLVRVQDIALRVGVGRAVRVVSSPALRSPAVFQGLRPTLALPRSFSQEFSADQQDAVLAHELSHLARRDPAWHAAASLACALLWWQPLVWWSRHRLRMASEAAADEASLLLPGGPSVLAASLVSLARRLTNREPIAGLAMHGNGLKSELARRVERLLSLEANTSRVPGALQLALVHGTLPVCFSLLGMICTAWTPSRHTFSQGDTTMSVVNNSWRSSLAATALWAALGTVTAVQADDPADEVRAEKNTAEKKVKRAAVEDRETAERKLREIQDKIAKLKNDGKEDEAEKLSKKAEKFRRLHLDRFGEQPNPNEIRKAIDKADEQTQRELERALIAEAEAKLAAERARREDLRAREERELGPYKEKLQALQQRVEQLVKEGKLDEAELVKRETKEWYEKTIAGRKPASDPEPKVMQHKLEAIHEQIDQLLKQGRKDEAERLKAHAEEILRTYKLDQGAKQDQAAAEHSLVEQKLRAMKEQIAQLNGEGRKDEAAKLANQLEDAVRRLHGEGPDKAPAAHRDAVEQKLRAMKDKVDFLYKEGRKDEASRLEQQLSEAVKQFHGTPTKGPDGMEQKLQAARDQIEELRRQGRKEEAQKLQQQLEEFDLSRQKVQQDAFAAAEKERRHMREMQVKQLQEAGRYEEAKQLLQELTGQRGKFPGEAAAQDELRAQLKQMQRELQEVREQLRKLQDERGGK